MSGTGEDGVEALKRAALAGNEPVALLLKAAERTAPKVPWKGRRKLDKDEVIAVTRAVTAMMERFGLKPSTVLQVDGRASTAGATYRFFLTRKEMAGAPVRRRGTSLALNIGAHVDNARSIARHARLRGYEVADEDLLAQLAAAVPAFLEQFRDEALDPSEELAAHICEIAAWLASPHRGIEVVRCMAEASRRDLVFSRKEGRFRFDAHAGDYTGANMPTVPLFTRVVAEGRAEVLVRDPQEAKAEGTGDGIGLFFPLPKLIPVGRARCVVVYRVGLGAVMAEGGRSLRMAFTLDPETLVGQPIGGVDDPHWETKGYSRYLVHRGIPVPGEAQGIDGRDGHWYRVEGKLSVPCPEFMEHVREISDENGWTDPWAPYTRRVAPVTAASCDRFLTGRNDDFQGLRHFADVEELTVLPEEALLEGGIESRELRDRFTEMLYLDGEGSIPALLLAEAEKRTRALEAFEMQEVSGVRAKKQAFLRRMRR